MFNKIILATVITSVISCSIIDTALAKRKGNIIYGIKNEQDCNSVGGVWYKEEKACRAY